MWRTFKPVLCQMSFSERDSHRTNHTLILKEQALLEKPILLTTPGHPLRANHIVDSSDSIVLGVERTSLESNRIIVSKYSLHDRNRITCHR
jgi:hypothetical protein